MWREFGVDHATFLQIGEAARVEFIVKRMTRPRRKNWTRIPPRPAFLLRAQRDKIVETQRADNVLIIVEKFIDGIIVVIDRKEHNDVLIPAAFAMRIVRGRGDRIASGGSCFFQTTVRMIQPVLALNNEGFVQAAMAMQDDLSLRVEFEQHMRDTVRRVYVEDGKGKMFDAIEASPTNVRVVESELRHVSSPLTGQLRLSERPRRGARDARPKAFGQIAPTIRSSERSFPKGVSFGKGFYPPNRSFIRAKKPVSSGWVSCEDSSSNSARSSFWRLVSFCGVSTLIWTCKSP